MATKSKKIRLIFLLYWFLLAYIIAALVWWYIALSRQNNQMTLFKLQRIQTSDELYQQQYDRIMEDKKRKTAQYIGEGAIFFLIIGAGAYILYRAVNNQLKISQQQQNFMMAITHELKTPIAVTKLNLETLQKRKLDEPQQQRLFSNTLQEANRMNALCNNMLISSQIEAGGYRITKEEINLTTLVEESVLDFCNRFPNKKILFSPKAVVYVLGDTLLLQMAVNNLIDNAIKYAPKESPLYVNIETSKDWLTLEIIDEGNGIEDSDKKKVFEKFYRMGNDATRRAKGTGLGLYLVAKIIEAHQGKIFVRNNEPKGAIFVVQFKPFT